MDFLTIDEIITIGSLVITGIVGGVTAIKEMRGAKSTGTKVVVDSYHQLLLDVQEEMARSKKDCSNTIHELDVELSNMREQNIKKDERISALEIEGDRKELRIAELEREMQSLLKGKL